MAAVKKVATKPAVKKARVLVATEKVVRRAVVDEVAPASVYFANVSEKTGLKFISSGSAVLDAALGGGWVLGRVVNIVGDRSAGKTLLAIEACANFNKQYPNGKIRYNEAEAAFDEAYAEALGMPKGVVDFTGMVISAEDEEKLAAFKAIATDRDAAERERAKAEASIKRLEAKGVGRPTNTVESLHDDIVHTLDNNKGRPILYIIDSLDALSDEAEQDRGIGESSYGGSKPKKMGEMFRRLVDRMEAQEMLLVVISQLRDKLNVTFGEKQTRSGGRALDFYASHIVWLAETGKIKKTMAKVDRIIGVNVRARVKKNKVGLPFRECAYPILFGYGVDDLTAGVEWLIEVGLDEQLKTLGISKAGYKISLPKMRDRGGEEVREFRKALNSMVFTEWQRIEQGFLPKTGKYS